MRRAVALLALAVLSAVAGAVTAAVLHAQPAASPCVTAPALPPPVVLLDSAGILVGRAWRHAAAAPGTYCPATDVTLRFAHAVATLTPGDPPSLAPVDSTPILIGRAGWSPLWADTASVARATAAGAWRDWRTAVPVLAARLHTAPAPPVVGQACDVVTGPWTTGVATSATVQVDRRDELRVLALPAGACAAVVRWHAVPGVGDRYLVFYPPCGDAPAEWRRFPTAYTTRSGALTRARQPAPACRTGSRRS
jgi:hypothetical protein